MRAGAIDGEKSGFAASNVWTSWDNVRVGKRVGKQLLGLWGVWKRGRNGRGHVIDVCERILNDEKHVPGTREGWSELWLLGFKPALFQCQTNQKDQTALRSMFFMTEADSIPSRASIWIDF
uniref:Ribonuclease H protein n=1 Tax=Steinernema glaseri TaxID=37863 RepID=A0A1I7YCQ6_9BILA